MSELKGYNPYRDEPIWADGTPCTPSSTIRAERGQIYTVQYVELSQDTIERIADAIARRLKDVDKD